MEIVTDDMELQHAPTNADGSFYAELSSRFEGHPNKIVLLTCVLQPYPRVRLPCQPPWKREPVISPEVFDVWIRWIEMLTRKHGNEVLASVISIDETSAPLVRVVFRIERRPQ